MNVLLTGIVVPGASTITNVENLNINTSGAGFTIDTTSYTGLTAVKVASSTAGPISVTGATTTSATVLGTGASTVDVIGTGAHEYFNRDWLPMSFADMGRWLQPAKLNFAASANYLDYVEAVNLTPDQQALLKEIPDELIRQTVRDCMVNQQFRKDYWVKGARKLNVLEQAETLRAQKVILIQNRADVSLKFTGALGEATMQEAVYNPVLDALADHKPKTLGQIEQAVKDKGVTFAQVTQAVMILAGAGPLAAVQEDALIPKAKKHTDKLNAHLIDKARGSGDIGYLASPVTGGGVTVGRFQQLFLLAMSQGKKQPAEWAQFVWQVLTAQGQKIVKEGKTLESAEENLAELTLQATVFAAKQLPIMKALQVG